MAHSGQIDMELHDGVVCTRQITLDGTAHEIVFMRPSTETDEGRMFFVALAMDNRQILGQLIAPDGGDLTLLRLIGQH